MNIAGKIKRLVARRHLDAFQDHLPDLVGLAKGPCGIGRDKHAWHRTRCAGGYERRSADENRGAEVGDQPPIDRYFSVSWSAK